MTLNEIKNKTKKNKKAKLKRLAELCNTDGNYKKSRKKPRLQAEKLILDKFAAEGYY